jgi:putative redox protein
MTESYRKIEFPGSKGESLAARLDLPQGSPRAFALFAHCFTCGKDLRAARLIAASLAARGIALLRFDFTGLGHSDGEFANTNFSSNLGDILAAVDYLRKKYAAPQLLVGHSLGGAAVLAAAKEISEARAVATIGAPADAAHVAHNFQSAREEIEREGAASVTLAGRDFLIKKQFLDDIESQEFLSGLGSLKKALLIAHAPRDEIVGIENAGRIFAAAKHPKSFLSLDDADHLLSREQDAAYLASVLAAWAERYLNSEVPERSEASEGLPADPGVRVESRPDARFTHDVLAGRHRLVADEPRAVGGDDLGPAPYDYLLAGLGACTAMTLKMYADRKNWPLERVEVDLGHDRIHARDCASCETKEGRVDRIRRKIRIAGTLDEEQRNRLLEIADRCPVHKTLTSEIVIDTVLEE